MVLLLRVRLVLLVMLVAKEIKVARGKLVSLEQEDFKEIQEIVA